MNFSGSNGDGFQTACAVSVYCHAGNFLGVQAHEAYHSSNVQALLCFRRGIANNDIVDAFFIQLWEITQQLADDLFAQIIGTHKSKCSFAGFSNGGSVSSYDVCIHGFSF